MEIRHKHLLVYHRNPYLCARYSQYLLTFIPEFFSAILVSCPVELYRIKDLVEKELLSCVVFDTNDYPIVDLEMKGVARTYMIDFPEDREEVLMKLGGIS